MRSYSDKLVLFNTANGVATGASQVFKCRDYRHIVVALSTSGTATLTVKAVGSIGKSLAGIASVNEDDVPAFASAQSQTNHYEYINSVDYATNSVVAGATGYAASGADIVKLFEINTNHLDYVALVITAYTQGTVHAWVVGADN